MECSLRVLVLLENAIDVTADVTIPPGATYDPTDPRNFQGVPDDPLAPTSIHYGTVQLGLFNPGFPKQVNFWLRLRDDGSLAPGDVISMTAALHAANAPDHVVALSPALTVQPPPADLTASTVGCVETGPPPLRPGDELACSIALTNAALREDATAVVVQSPFPTFTGWVAGGTFHTASGATWLSSALPGGVPSGGPAPAPLTFGVRVAANTPGGTTLLPQALVAYRNALSGDPGNVALIGPPIVTAPGPAILTASALACTDVNGATLLTEEEIECRLTVANAAGRETAESVTAAVTIPAGTAWAAGGSGHDATAVAFDGAALGTIASGTSKQVAFRLRVGADTAVGTVVRPHGSVSGTSVPSATAIAHELDAAPLTVAARPAEAHTATTPAAPAKPSTPATPSTPAKQSTPAKPTTKPARKPSRICRSRRAFFIHVRPPRGQAWAAVAVKVGKRTARAARPGRGTVFRYRVVLKGLPRGRVVVRITGRTRSGLTVKSSRRYRTCTKKGA